jgi:hypothetical protein
MARSVTDSKNEFQDSIDAFSEQRTQVEEDIRFSDPSEPDQWDTVMRLARENDPGGVRLCLVHDQTSQYVANVAGQIEKSPPALHAVPVGGQADKKVAELIDGRFRHIEHVSAAQQHIATALTSAARLGVGYLTAYPTKVNERMRYMEPRIGSVSDALNVVFDPWSVELDGRDARVAWELIPMNPKVFKQNYPGKAATDFNSTQTNLQDDTRTSIIIAREWVKNVTMSKGVCYGDDIYATEDEYDEACRAAGQALPIKHKFKMEKCEVTCRYLSGDDELESSTYDADHIGIVPIYGYVGFKDGRIQYCGIPRRARAPQQSYNYHISELQAYMTSAPRAPWVVPIRALQSKGLKGLWDKANKEQRAYLPYDDLDQNGNPVAAPTRAQVSVSLQNHEDGANRALRDLQASIGMYQANIGAKSNVVSGVAYNAQKEQGEASTAHFPSHLAASLGHLGNIVMQMDIRLHDTKRESPVIHYDQSPGTVTVDPKAPSPYAKADGVVTINPTTGTYSVRVVVGASYATQREQTNRSLDEIMRSNKELAPIIAPEWARTLNIPGSERLAGALLAMAPPAVKAAMAPEGADGAPDSAALTAENAQLQEGMKEAIQHAQEAQDLADKLVADLAEAKRDAKVKEHMANVASYEATTNRLKVLGGNEEQLKSIAASTVAEAMAQPDPDEDEESGALVEGRQEAMRPDENPSAPAPTEPAAPMPPSPEMQALLQGQEKLSAAIEQLVKISMMPRKRTAVRDKKTGMLQDVIETLDHGVETLQ